MSPGETADRGARPRRSGRAERDPLATLVVDDEALARELVRDVLEGIEGVTVAGECPDGVAAVERIREDPPDLVLLDVQMPEVDGFEVIERVGFGAMPEVVFVTAHEEYAVRAFEVHALDYVLKPVDPERLEAAVVRARDRLAGGAEASLDARLEALLEDLESDRRGPPRWARRVTIRDGETIRFVDLDAVDWIEADGNYVRLHVGEDHHLVRTTLTGLLDRLDPARFVRIHRSAIVNLDRVREIEPWFSGDYVAILDDGQQLRVSRTFRDRLLKLAH